MQICIFVVKREGIVITAKFKVGDKVKVISCYNADSIKREYIGKIFTIQQVNPDKRCMSMGTHYSFKEGYCSYIFFEGELELVKFTKSDLKNGMVVTFKNGFRGLVVDNIIIGNSIYCDLSDYNDDLTTKDNSTSLNIIKVYNALSHRGFRNYLSDDNLELIWEREKPKKMTKQEIEKELGYSIEIISNKEGS